MIKIDGVDIPRIEYIDHVDGKVSILRVMKDGVQIWPAISEKPNIPTGIQLSEYEVETLEIPTGITLREVIQATINWDYTQMYAGIYDDDTLIQLSFVNEILDHLSGVPPESSFVVKVNDVATPVTGVSLNTTYVRLSVAAFAYGDEIKVSYTAGTNPLKAIDTGNLVPNIIDVVLDNVLPEPAYTYLLDDYPGAAAAYSLRKLSSTAVQGIMVRRDSDDQLVDVRLYDDPNKSIDLDSITESGGQTLGDWVGSASAFVATWYDQSGSGNHTIQAVGTRQPTLISSGVLIESNGKAALQSAITKGLYTASQILYDNTWSIHGVVEPSDLAPSSSSVILSQHTGLSDVGRTYYSYVTAGNLKTKLFFNNGTSYVGSASMDWALKQTSFSNYASSNNYSWSQDGSTPETVISGQTVTPVANPLGIGNLGNADGFGSYFSGVYQEFVIYDTNQSANREAIEDNINDHYNIYVVTAEVDAQLIQADNDNVSDTVIEINGVRSSASDTAVANLISRNNTIITN